MKFTTALSVLAASASIASAKSLLDDVPSKITVGETYNIEWSSDAKEKSELLLVHKTASGWEPTETFFKNKITEQPGGNYTWKVGKSTPTGDGYALWLSAASLKNPGTGYADLSKWFEIVAPEIDAAAPEGREDLKI